MSGFAPTVVHVEVVVAPTVRVDVTLGIQPVQQEVRVVGESGVTVQPENAGVGRVSLRYHLLLFKVLFVSFIILPTPACLQYRQEAREWPNCLRGWSLICPLALPLWQLSLGSFQFDYMILKVDPYGGKFLKNILSENAVNTGWQAFADGA